MISVASTLLRELDAAPEVAQRQFAPHSPHHKKAPAPPTAIERPPAPDFSYHGSPWLTGTSMGAAPPAPAAPQPSPRA